MLSSASLPFRRLRLEIAGAVQGVGFRPHVYRLATARGISGWVMNDASGVQVEVEGPVEVLEAFAEALLAAPPANARILGVTRSWGPPEGATGAFEIRASRAGATPTAVVLPDLAMCPDCLADLDDPDGRRSGYPFTNCTACGPRLSIVRKLPYDRPHTTMAGFEQCPECTAEYTSPLNRRFHAQPNACPACGPHLGWWTPAGKALEGIGTEAGGDAATDARILDAAAAALLSGDTLGVKGLGGFHLVVHATNDTAVRRLRRRKGRDAKPLAVMVRTVDEATRLAHVDADAAALLASPAAPIVLVPVRPGSALAPSVAPGNPRVGIMLAYTPLHRLLLDRVGGPVVATSGNRTDEPICLENDEAVERLGRIVDGLLVHDRPIHRPVDDSVVRVSFGKRALLRRSRGYAPLPLPLAFAQDLPDILAVGPHLKNTVAVARKGMVYLSQHVGDLDDHLAEQAFRRTIRDYLKLYRVRPEAVAHDAHPGYVSTRWAQDSLEAPHPEVRRIPVQHHHAHLASVLAEAGARPDDPPALGVIWDGTGYGEDGTIWGGEFLLGGLAYSQRVAHLRPFRLPGGDRAAREPRRSALGLLAEGGMLTHPGADSALAAFTREEERVVLQATERGLNSATTSSAGRLFDALASLLGLHQVTSFEGQAAMALEFAVDPSETGSYLLHNRPVEHGPSVLDWVPLVEAVLADRTRSVPVPTIAARIHNGLVDAMVRVAEMAGTETVALSGGCFQNAVLVERAAERLTAQGHRVLTNHLVPPGDGGIALGQIATAAARLAPGRASATLSSLQAGA